VITGVERRRKWSAQEKVAIVAESLAEGAVVSEVARRHGLSPQQLFGWRSRLRDAVKGSAPSSDATPAFVPAIVEDDLPSPAAPALPAAAAMSAAGVAPIEIAVGGVIVRVRGEAELETAAAKAEAEAEKADPKRKAAATRKRRASRDEKLDHLPHEEMVIKGQRPGGLRDRQALAIMAIMDFAERLVIDHDRLRSQAQVLPPAPRM